RTRRGAGDTGDANTGRVREAGRKARSRMMIATPNRGSMKRARPNSAHRSASRQVTRSRRAIVAVWLLAFAVRCVYLWQISHAPFYDLRLGDANAYDAWARRIAADDWIGQGVFYQAPLYPYLLALLYRMLGDGVTVVRMVQALLGASSCALLAAAAASFVDEKRAVIAGALLAVYPPAIFLDGLLEKSSFVTFFTVLLLWLVSKPPTGMTLRRWLAAGAALGLLTLTRENAVLLVLPLLLWIVVTPRSTRARSLPAAALAAGCLAILLPVGVRNFVAG